MLVKRLLVYGVRMRNPERAGSLLANAHAVDLILFIREKEEILAYQLREVHSNYTSMFALAGRLSQAGIIDMKEQRSPRVTYTFKLTAKGKKVAEKLREAKEIIGC